MADEIAGGVYEDGPDAGTYHDANGKPVNKDGTARDHKDEPKVEKKKK